jgi:tRNA pseudouridine38-40 synthase
LNAILPEDIKIWQLLKLSPDFSPKNSIEWKEYEYIVAMGPVLDPLLRNRAWWIRAPLKVKVIQRHLKKFMGEQDFVGFMKRPKNFKGSTIRKIFKAEVKAISSPAIRSLTILRFRFRGSGFLHNMVRNFVTDAVEVGRGRSLDEAGDLAPPGALCLTRSKVKSKYFEIISY